MTFVRAESVETSSVVANVWIALTLVDIDTRVTAGRQSVSASADALERALEIVTFAVVANAWTIATLVDICQKIKFENQIEFFTLKMDLIYQRNLFR